MSKEDQKSWLRRYDKPKIAKHNLAVLYRYKATIDELVCLNGVLPVGDSKNSQIVRRWDAAIRFESLWHPDGDESMVFGVITADGERQSVQKSNWDLFSDLKYRGDDQTISEDTLRLVSRD